MSDWTICAALVVIYIARQVRKASAREREARERILAAHRAEIAELHDEHMGR